MPKKNVLFILTDDQRYNTLHALGNNDIITPNMDWLVKNGVSFTNAHIPGGTSGAVCMPSRAMLNSGRTLFHIEGEGQSIPETHTTLGQAFKEAGWETFGTGKWHNGPPAYTRSFSCGDNAFFGGMWDHWNVPLNYYDPTGEYDNVINFVGNFMYGNQPMQVHCDKFIPGKHSSELLTDTAVEYLRTREDEKPFFLYLAYLAPHDPRTMPKKYLELYDPEKISLPPNCLAEHPFDFGVFGIRDEVLASYPRREDEIRKHLTEYYAMITHLDAEIGRIIEVLREKGELENTLIILTGDNGLAVGCHGLMGKQNHYEHSIRVPLVFCGPGLGKDVRNDHFVYLLDIFPTLCELNGLAIPESVEGLSFKRMFDDPTYATRDKLYFAYCDMLRSVKDGKYKLIEYRNTANETQLFDLENDPWELRNLYGRREYEAVAESLRKDLLHFKETWEDTGSAFTTGFWGQSE